MLLAGQPSPASPVAPPAPPAPPPNPALVRPVPYTLATDLCTLVDSGSLSAVAAFLSSRPEMNVNTLSERMVTPLQQACTSPQSLPLARLLLARGASPHFAVPGLCITPLHAAA